ncbi:MAG: MBL fold metallo-hydrolase [Lentisphaerae bacterium]|nr:MBL fold metallo-hydrolase [Lentisphaerota bacterium]
MKVCVLGSGSTGNCTLVATGRCRVLIDAGLSAREIARRLQPLGVGIETVDAVCVTHEHDDHRSGLGVLARRYGVALYGNAGTIEGIERTAGLRGLDWNVFTTGAPFEIGDLRLEPFSVPHDSYDPVGFIVSSGGARVGIVTDMGMATELIRARLRECAAVIIESNHDEAMLREAARPWSVKQRIAGRQGHLSNAQAAALAAAVAGPALRTVMLAHLSAQCNAPALALEAVRGALAAAGFGHVAVGLTYADRAGDVIEIEA